MNLYLIIRDGDPPPSWGDVKAAVVCARHPLSARNHFLRACGNEAKYIADRNLIWQKIGVADDDVPAGCVLIEVVPG